MAQPTLKMPFEQYRRVQAETSSGADLVLLLYQGAIRFMNRALAALDANNVEGAHNALVRAQDILRELQVTLNHQAGGELAAGLASIYDYCVQRLIEANIRKAPEPVSEVKRIVQELAAAWEEAMRDLRSSGRKGGPQPFA